MMTIKVPCPVSCQSIIYISRIKTLCILFLVINSPTFDPSCPLNALLMHIHPISSYNTLSLALAPHQRAHALDSTCQSISRIRKE